jgi:serine protease Do
MHDLPRMVADTPVGEEVSIVVLRKGEEVELKVTLGRLEEADKIADAEDGADGKPGAAAKETEVLGMTLAPVSDELRQKHSIAADVAGVVVTAVATGSPAEEKRIAAGDVIVEVAQESVSTPADISARLKALKDEGRRLALFLVSNAQGEVRFIPLPIADD